jgi:cobalt/nickel transport system permease protein
MPEMPAWLLREERYQPLRDQDRFLDRSILAFLALLARGGALGGAPAGLRPEAPVKVLAALVTLLLVALSRSPVFVAVAGTGLLALTALQEGRVIAAVLKAAGLSGLFTLLVMLPAAIWGRAPAALMITVKVCLSTACVRLVAASTGPAALAEACKRLGAPDLFILVFDLALKYIILLGEFALTMLHALKLRSVGRNPGKTGSLGGIAGTLFLTSKEMAEEMYDGMVCRGFTGEYRVTGRAGLGLPDAALGVAVGLLAAAFLLLRRG